MKEWLYSGGERGDPPLALMVRAASSPWRCFHHLLIAFSAARIAT
jgi:hypothetical protein